MEIIGHAEAYNYPDFSNSIIFSEILIVEVFQILNLSNFMQIIAR